MVVASLCIACCVNNTLTLAEPSETGSTSAITRKRCRKCSSLKKSGKLSCCARGGAWFQRCGAAADSSSEHTWVEGIQACNSFRSYSIEEPAQAMLLLERVIAEPATKTSQQNLVKQHAKIHLISDAFNASITDLKVIVELAKIVAFASVLCVSP